MRRVAWRVAGTAALCAAAVAAEEEDGSGSGSGSADAHRVLTLEDDTFEAAIQAEVLLVEFYAPWCGHCKEIAPAYDLAAQQLGKIHGKQLLAKIDATNSASAVVKYKVHSYPTILLFSEGENVDELSGARSATDITAYMSKFARGPEEMIALKESIARTKAAEAGTGHLVLATPDMYNDFLLDHAEGTVVTFFHAKFCQVRPCPCRNRLFNHLISHGLRICCCCRSARRRCASSQRLRTCSQSTASLRGSWPRWTRGRAALAHRARRSSPAPAPTAPRAQATRASW